MGCAGADLEQNVGGARALGAGRFAASGGGVRESPPERSAEASDELDSKVESKVAKESLTASASFSVSCLPCLAGGSPSVVFNQAVNRLCFYRHTSTSKSVE